MTTQDYHLSDLHDSILVERLFECYDPFARLFNSYYDYGIGAAARLPNFNLVKPTRRYRPDGFESRCPGERSQRYHRGRVAYFRDQFLARESVDPITMDNECASGHIYGPIIVDGHHRFCGAILAREPRIEVFYSGRLDILYWLQGKTNKSPLF
jgi:hypothetical protein